MSRLPDDGVLGLACSTPGMIPHGPLSRWTGKQGDGSDLSVGIDETRGVWRGAAGVMVDRRLVVSIGYFPGGSTIEHIATGCTLRATGSG